MHKEKSLLIVAHTPSDNTRALGQALLRGAQDSMVENVACSLKSPFECTASDVLACDALILFTTENFGYMSGALKDFFDRVYYPCQEDPTRNEAKPFTLVIRAGLDGTGTDTAVHKIIKGLKWREAHNTLICKGDFQTAFIEQCHQVGLSVAASLDNNLI